MLRRLWCGLGAFLVFGGDFGNRGRAAAFKDKKDGGDRADAGEHQEDVSAAEFGAGLLGVASDGPAGSGERLGCGFPLGCGNRNPSLPLRASFGVGRKMIGVGEPRNAEEEMIFGRGGSLLPWVGGRVPQRLCLLEFHQSVSCLRGKRVGFAFGRT